MHDIEGHNYRMEEIQAAVLNVKAKYINEWTDKRRKVAGIYTKELSSIGGENLTVPYCSDEIKAVYHLYVIRTPRRDELSKYLNDKGIQTALHYPLPLHMQKAYKYLNYKEGDFPAAEKCCKQILSLPLYPEMTEEQTDYVISSIKSFFD